MSEKGCFVRLMRPKSRPWTSVCLSGDHGVSGTSNYVRFCYGESEAVEVRLKPRPGAGEIARASGSEAAATCRIN